MKIIDHKARKQEILKKALVLLGEMGYQQVTFQQIADACGIPRSSLYKYYQDKRQIFDFALKQLMEEIGNNVKEAILDKPELSSAAKLEMVAKQAVDLCMTNPQLLQTIFEYLISVKRTGEAIERKIRKHTIGFRMAISDLLIEGIEKGEFRKISVKLIADMIFGLVEAVCMQIMFYEKVNSKLIVQQCRQIINSIKA